MADSEGIKSAVILRSEDDFGGTPLHEASYFDHPDVVQAT